MVQMGIARAIAGLGGGGIMTMASVVIHDLLPMRRRGQYQSYVNMAQTVSTRKQLHKMATSRCLIVVFLDLDWYYNRCSFRRYYQ